ncbi:MAG: ceramidase domain-containing protein [Hyphomicrobium sp.]
MDWSKVYSYCERGGDPGFWAEPLNAISNGAFVLAGLVAGWQLARSQRSDTAWFEWLLIALSIAIGVGSFMFHTYATVWAIPFDTVPISLFMLAYLGYALRRFAGAPWIVVIAALIGFYYSHLYAQGIHCSNELLSHDARGRQALLQRHARL